ncbi:M3 family oligoendopeptidase [Longirhabdus pacifica]|uniref:M3 family oligoendopeptidase n=1 Tax=Longirhabdus pacifica TaxID=2305227 RepID=UPI001008D188|nr:M3 family oligoendopeptidase [Longirhabdus pacifica]
MLHDKLATPFDFSSSFVHLQTATIQEKCEYLLQCKILSVQDLERWLQEERELSNLVHEYMVRQKVTYYQDTANQVKKERYTTDQKTIHALWLKYQAQLDKKFCQHAGSHQLDDEKYGVIKRKRFTRVEQHRDDNIPLFVREKELGAAYSEIMANLTVEWDGNNISYNLAKTYLNHPNGDIRKQAWLALAKARQRIKPQIDSIMDELISLRHQIAIQAGFQNYVDYMFESMGREYSMEDCHQFYSSAEKHIVPIWNQVSKLAQSNKQCDVIHPWDQTQKLIGEIPSLHESQLLDGVQSMLHRTDDYIAGKFKRMREHGLIDVTPREGKHHGAFMDPLLTSKEALISSHFHTSFEAHTALIHEMGHAIHMYMQFDHHQDVEEQYMREEIAELFSHGLEMLCLDKIDVFYTDQQSCTNAQIELLRRAVNLMIGPLSDDLFQHWLYTHPHHTAKERNHKYFEISKRFRLNPVHTEGLQSEIGNSWMEKSHFFLHPFYSIEYSISILGALQLLALYHEDPNHAIHLYKKGASTSIQQSIHQIYNNTGVAFDFSEKALQRVGQMIEKMLYDLLHKSV